MTANVFSHLIDLVPIISPLFYSVEVEDEASLKPKLAANVEKARVAMNRLQEIFQDNPSLQTGLLNLPFLCSLKTAPKR